MHAASPTNAVLGAVLVDVMDIATRTGFTMTSHSALGALSLLATIQGKVLDLDVSSLRRRRRLQYADYEEKMQAWKDITRSAATFMNIVLSKIPPPPGGVDNTDDSNVFRAVATLLTRMDPGIRLELLRTSEQVEQVLTIFEAALMGHSLGGGTLVPLEHLHSAQFLQDVVLKAEASDRLPPDALLRMEKMYGELLKTSSFGTAVEVVGVDQGIVTAFESTLKTLGIPVSEMTDVLAEQPGGVHARH